MYAIRSYYGIRIAGDWIGTAGNGVAQGEREVRSIDFDAHNAEVEAPMFARTVCHDCASPDEFRKPLEKRPGDSPQKSSGTSRAGKDN